MVVTKPVDMQDCGVGMSNFDHVIDDGFEDALRSKPNELFGFHAAYNFNGQVWFDGEQFHEEVWVYGAPRKTYSAATLIGLMRDVNDDYGSE